MTYIHLITNSLTKIYLEDNVLIIKLTSANYNKEEWTTSIEYIKNFWLLINEGNQKYHMLFNLFELGTYPIDVLKDFKETLLMLNYIFVKNLHSSVLLIDNDFILNLLNPLIKMYKAVRPFKIMNNMEDTISFFKDNKNLD